MDNYNLRIKYIIDKYEKLLLNNSNIIGFGRGLKIINGNMTKQPTITIFVEKKINKDKLNSNSIIPNKLNGVVTDVIESGEIVECAGVIRPTKNGVNIQNENKPHGGTLGCVVTEKDTKKNLYILSCAHVLSRNFKGVIGDVILQPGKNKGGDSIKSKIGRLAGIAPIIFEKDKKYESSKNEIDAAIALVGKNDSIVKESVLSPKMLNGTTIKGITVVKPGDSIYKIGSNTGNTSGNVIAVDVTKIVNYRDPEYPGDDTKRIKAKLVNSISVEIKTLYGDSGAIGLTSKENNVFGMLYSGSAKNGVATFCPIQSILSFFNVDIVTN